MELQLAYFWPLAGDAGIALVCEQAFDSVQWWLSPIRLQVAAWGCVEVGVGMGGLRTSRSPEVFVPCCSLLARPRMGFATSAQWWVYISIAIQCSYGFTTWRAPSISLQLFSSYAAIGQRSPPVSCSQRIRLFPPLPAFALIQSLLGRICFHDSRMGHLGSLSFTDFRPYCGVGIGAQQNSTSGVARF